MIWTYFSKYLSYSHLQRVQITPKLSLFMEYKAQLCINFTILSDRSMFLQFVLVLQDVRQERHVMLRRRGHPIPTNYD